MHLKMLAPIHQEFIHGCFHRLTHDQTQTAAHTISHTVLQHRAPKELEDTVEGWRPYALNINTSLLSIVM